MQLMLESPTKSEKHMILTHILINWSLSLNSATSE